MVGSDYCLTTTTLRAESLSTCSRSKDGVEPTFMADYIGTPMFNILSIVMFVALCVYLVMHSMKVNVENE